jgi:group II intron reverse transcriptase/maturase
MHKSLTKIGVGQLTLTFGPEPKDGAEETEDNGSAASSSVPAVGCTKERKFKWHSLIDKVYALPNLHKAWEKVRTNKGAAGVDRMTVTRFAECTDERILALHADLRNKTYRPQPVRRVVIPKSGGGTRPLGIPTVRDRIVQQALLQVLEPIFEGVFSSRSHGFRKDRGCATALDVVDRAIRHGYSWVVDADIEKFFDTVDHDRLLTAVNDRVSDGSVLRLIRQILTAGAVLPEVSSTEPTELGTPQGGVISPLLANIYLHYVLDEWFEREVKPRLRGRAFLIRYADDFVMGFACEEDARRVLEVLPKRFGKYGLTLHPDKTRLVPFVRLGVRPGSGDAGPAAGAFDLLGFTHYWGRSRRGGWVVKRKTASNRFSRAVKKIAEWCRRNRHQPITVQHRALSQKLQGHDAYYGITGNFRALDRLRRVVERVWRKWLARRRGAGSLLWERFGQLLERFPLPAARIVHSVYR